MKNIFRSQRGFSLVELGVAMAVMGMMGIFVWRWVETTRAPMERPEMQRQLNEAQAALEGFLLAHHRLPCSATTTNGNESCADAAAVHFPWRTLGMSSELGQLHYGVNRGAGMDLAALPSASVSPDLNINFTDMPVLPTYTGSLSASAAVTAAAARAQAAITQANTRRAAVNGLDWCRTLRGYAANLSAAGALTAGNVSSSLPVAYVLVHPGSNNQFEGNNAIGASGTWRFDLPGQAQQHDFDDIALAVGPADLGTRLGCVGRLGAMQASAQGAYAAYDNARVMQQYWSLRVFDIATAESALESAEAGVTMAAMGLALATTSAVLSIASAANTEGVTAFIVAMAAVNVGVAVAETVLAAQDLTDAQEALEDSKDKLAAADTYAVQVYDTFTQALTQAIRLDTKGLNP